MVLTLLVVQCSSITNMKKKTLDIQGHRGTRGHMPENTIPAFIKAVDMGVTTLELDLAVTKDHQLVVSHEPYFGAHISIDSTGRPISPNDELAHNIYTMTYQQVATYDVGSKFHERFPDQMKMKVSKPLFKEVVDSVSRYCRAHGLADMRYNIEIKSLPEGDDKFHPTPDVFSQLVYGFIKENMEMSLVNVQSFDFRILQYFHQHFPEIVLAVLIENEQSIDENLTNLGFVPEIYSCDYTLLDQSKVDYLHDQGMRVIPWTVNNENDIREVISWRIDGIISDYPDRVIKAISE